MAIKRYIADADTTITNAYKANLATRGVSGNMGESDILEAFSIFAQANTSSTELSRILVKFPATGTSAGYISYDREQGNIPASGSVSFYMRMYNAKHSSTTPKDFKLVVTAVSRSWNEGLGLDMENYSDIDAANWIEAERSSSAGTHLWNQDDWGSDGGSWISDGSSSFTASFDTGFEDMDLDITPLVEQWVSSSVQGKKENYGVIIKLASSLESLESSNTSSYYTKRFFARGSQFFYKRPIIEARWDSSKADDRGNFYYSSSLAPAVDNLNTLYLYNNVRGQLKNIPAIGTGSIIVSLYSGSSTNSGPSGSKLALSAGGDVAAAADTNVTGGYVATGIYSASVAFTGSTTLKTIFDVWHSSSVEYFTGSLKPKSLSDVWPGSEINPNQQYVSTITNLRPAYSTENTAARFRLYTRKKDWSPTIYNVSSQKMPISLVDDAFYKVIRVNDGWEAIAYGTGSDKHTKLSFDTSGSYFNLDMSMLEGGYTYALKFIYYLNGQYAEQPEEFRFKVE
jgi:hypothetical protein